MLVPSFMEFKLEESDCFHFLRILFVTLSLILWSSEKLDCQSRMHKSQQIIRFRIKHCDWFILLLLLLLPRQWSFHWIIRKTRKQNQYSASYAIGLIFFRITLHFRIYVWLHHWWKLACKGPFTRVIFVTATWCNFCHAQGCNFTAISQGFRTRLKLDAILARQKLHRVATTKIACVNGP